MFISNTVITLLLCHDNVSGTTRVNWTNTQDRRLVNLRLTGSISGHSDYQRKMTEILRLIGACQEELKINKFYSRSSSFRKTVYRLSSTVHVQMFYFFQQTEKVSTHFNMSTHLNMPIHLNRDCMLVKNKDLTRDSQIVEIPISRIPKYLGK